LVCSIGQYPIPSRVRTPIVASLLRRPWASDRRSDPARPSPAATLFRADRYIRERIGERISPILRKIADNAE